MIPGVKRQFTFLYPTIIQLLPLNGMVIMINMSYLSMLLCVVVTLLYSICYCFQVVHLALPLHPSSPLTPVSHGRLVVTKWMSLAASHPLTTPHLAWEIRQGVHLPTGGQGYWSSISSKTKVLRYQNRELKKHWIPYFLLPLKMSVQCLFKYSIMKT